MKTLSVEALAGVVELYPWFGSARKELCRRTGGLSADGASAAAAAEAALYVGSRRSIADILREGKSEDYSDRDAEKLLKAYLENVSEEQPAAAAPVVRVVGGDYFTQAEYDNVRRTADDVFTAFASSRPEDSAVRRKASEPAGMDWFCTETLAQIYIEQGYLEDAKRIYSKLILAYPEKNAYFAALIEKLDRAASL